MAANLLQLSTMWITLGHENSDFDAVAAQWLATRLYPDTIPLLARRINRNVQQFLALYGGFFRFELIANWPRQWIEGVILVDTQSLPNVRGIRPKTQIHVVDHHPQEVVRPSWSYQVETVGATTTILVERIADSSLAVSAEEATLFLLGIYEDTGCLTYDTTTARDARATAWLINMGANLTIVRRFLEIPLSPAQLKLYHQLLDAIEWHTIEGQILLLTAVQGSADFEEEISTVATKLRDTFVPTAMIVLVALPHRVHLIARSSSDEVDVGILAKAFGGGGHSRAAASTLHHISLPEARRKVLSWLKKIVRPIMRVSQIMSHHVKTIQIDQSVASADVQMRRYGHEGYPVVDRDGKLVGLLTRQVVDRAMQHRLDKSPIAQLMHVGRVTALPSDSITQLQVLMADEGWGQIPVVSEEDGDQIVGIVTRTDLLRALMVKSPQAKAHASIQEQLHETLSPAIWQLLQAISQIAQQRHLPIYFVGGLVRDLLLGKSSPDIDIVVEGYAPDLTQQLVTSYGGRHHLHAQFGTAKWLISAETWQTIGITEWDPTLHSLDFVSARTEYYTEPTALPTVTRGSIKLDLLRRDFTINTLAIRLDGAHIGELLDFYGGLRDLEQGAIRVLHSLSFVDDPTRILRAVRFEQRFQFAIEPRTLELLIHSVSLLGQVTGARLWHELEKLFAEEHRIAMMERLAELGALQGINEALRWSKDSAESFRQLTQLLTLSYWTINLKPKEYALLYLLVWLNHHPVETQLALVARFYLSKDVRIAITQLEQLCHLLVEVPLTTLPSQIEKQLRPFAQNPFSLLACRVLLHGTTVATWLDRYQQEWKNVKPLLTGRDLLAMGIPSGARIAFILDQLLAAYLDGALITKSAEDERIYLQTLLNKQNH